MPPKTASEKAHKKAESPLGSISAKYTPTTQSSIRAEGAASNLYPACSYSKNPETPKKPKHWVIKAITTLPDSSTSLEQHYQKLRFQITNCYLSRVLDAPKTKFTGPNSIASRVTALDGQHEGDVTKYTLVNLIRSKAPSPPTHGILKTALFLILTENWDNKFANLTSPPVRPFDLDSALQVDSDKQFQTQWTEEKLGALILGKSIGENKIPEAYHPGTTHAVAYALTQIFIECGTRANGYEGYSSYRGAVSQSYGAIIGKTLIEEINVEKKDGENASLTLVRLLKETAQEIEAKRTQSHIPEAGSKNPAAVIKQELSDHVFPQPDGQKRWYPEEARDSLCQRACEFVDAIDLKLTQNLINIPLMAETLVKEHDSNPSFPISQGLTRQLTQRLNSGEGPPLTEGWVAVRPQKARRSEGTRLFTESLTQKPAQQGMEL